MYRFHVQLLFTIEYINYIVYFYCRKRVEKRRPLSTNEIADQLEECDDSDKDPDYEDEGGESSSTEDEDEPVVSLGKMVERRERKEKEIRVFMDPPQERPDGDTDKDSGMNTNTNNDTNTSTNTSTNKNNNTITNIKTNKKSFRKVKL